MRKTKIIAIEGIDGGERACRCARLKKTCKSLAIP